MASELARKSKKELEDLIEQHIMKLISCEVLGEPITRDEAIDASCVLGYYLERYGENENYE